ncbi:beta/gamma crystallin-related protein [Aliivibrio fischeri]|uniref:beta/gamma crystallin-related protein n=1 Tax=Aliivibrio fischeri TaxID=668 RepID=UPI0007C42F30|nr:beta/gamma crystallin-related protein [Aliivibrio fischeri]
MKKIIILTALLSVSSASYAGFNFNTGNESRIYICTLQPFKDIFAEAGITEDIARYEVQRRCEKSQGGDSIFCKSREAKCSQSTIVLGIESNGNQSIEIYSQNNQRGSSVKINHNEPDLNDYNFNDRMSSYDIPSGWTVRFYEGKNYTGGFYTRKGGEGNATGFDNKVSSIKILSTF